MPRQDLLQRLLTIAAALRALDDDDATENAREIERHLGHAEAWLARPHGEHVWIEIGATFRALLRAPGLPARTRAAVVAGERAWGEAETLITHRAAGLVVLARAA